MKLEDCIKLDKIFNSSYTPNWIYALTHIGSNIIFYDNAVLVYYIEDGICVVNSRSYNDTVFPPKMLKHIKRLITAYDKIIISSTKQHIAKHLFDKYNLVYANNTYSKGL